MPGRQEVVLVAEQEVAPATLVVPAGQALHAVAPAASENVPATQRSQIVAPLAAEYVPRGHCKQDEAAPVAEKVPKGHCLHSAALTLSEKVPGTQPRQAVVPAGTNMPGWQEVVLVGEHEVAPATLVVPAGHALHTVAPATSEKVPTAHRKHAVVPITA